MTEFKIEKPKTNDKLNKDLDNLKLILEEQQNLESEIFDLKFHKKLNAILDKISEEYLQKTTSASKQSEIDDLKSDNKLHEVLFEMRKETFQKIISVLEQAASFGNTMGMNEFGETVSIAPTLEESKENFTQGLIDRIFPEQQKVA